MGHIHVFAGAVSSAVAYIFARYAATPGGEGTLLSGTLTGPICDLSRTLQARIPLRDMGTGPTTLAKCILPDPCLWTPELPNWYHVAVELHRADGSVESQASMLGLRALGAHRQSFWRENGRIVMRGVSTTAIPFIRQSGWQQYMLGASIANPTDGQCELASRNGVPLVGHISGISDVKAEYLRLARWPAINVVTLTHSMLDDLEIDRNCDRPLIAVRTSDTTDASHCDGADAMWLECTSRDMTIAAVRNTPLPVIVHQTMTVTDLEQGRAACEGLQQRLCPELNLAGYFVGPRDWA